MGKGWGGEGQLCRLSKCSALELYTHRELLSRALSHRQRSRSRRVCPSPCLSLSKPETLTGLRAMTRRWHSLFLTPKKTCGRVCLCIGGELCYYFSELHLELVCGNFGKLVIFSMSWDSNSRQPSYWRSPVTTERSCWPWSCFIFKSHTPSGWGQRGPIDAGVLFNDLGSVTQGSPPSRGSMGS